MPSLPQVPAAGGLGAAPGSPAAGGLGAGVGLGAAAPEEIVLLVTRAERLLSRRLREVVEAHGRTADEWRVLSILADGQGHPMTEVAEHAFLPPGTLTKLVDHLVDEGLVYRRIDPMDRRRIRAYVTARGRTAYERITADIRATWAELPVGPEEGDHLATLLRGLVSALTH